MNLYFCACAKSRMPDDTHAPINGRSRTDRPATPNPQGWRG
ncbi:hypothetical protein SXCC_02181 [Gluconacetobacter sp. SXCC-1]|nr:hypothetical protein SXCC_02181 [Gluconacetobacter sp. SXCC-1]